MIYLSAGHYNNDPGAISNGYQENKLTMELRDLICIELANAGAGFINDRDDESLAQYLKRIKPGSGSVVCELHFNAAAPKATGIEVLVKDNADAYSKALAADMAYTGSREMRLTNRGVKSESQSHRGRLGLLHSEAGISVLVEVCFITNPVDMQSYQETKKELARVWASLLIKYDALAT